MLVHGSGVGAGVELELEFESDDEFDDELLPDDPELPELEVFVGVAVGLFE